MKTSIGFIELIVNNELNDEKSMRKSIYQFFPRLFINIYLKPIVKIHFFAFI